MLIEQLTRNGWVSAVVWAALYIGDYTLTIIGAKLYQRGASTYFTFEKGYELNPTFQRDIAKLRIFSPRFITLLFTTCVLIFIVWYLSLATPNLFAFLLGALILVEVSVHLRHIRNILLFWFVLHRGGVEGHISYAGWLSYKVSALELASFAGLYLLVYLLTGSVFFLGGVAACMILCLKHLWLSRSNARIQSRKSQDVTEATGGNGDRGDAQKREDH